MAMRTFENTNFTLYTLLTLYTFSNTPLRCIQFSYYTQEREYLGEKI